MQRQYFKVEGGRKGKLRGEGGEGKFRGREGEGKFKGGGRGKGNLRGREGGRKKENLRGGEGGRMEILTFILFGSEYKTDKGKRKFGKGQTTT